MDKNKEGQVCLGHFAEEEELNRIALSLENQKGLELLGKIFKGMGDPSRMKILYILTESSLCVCDIAQVLDMTQSLVSHHLRTLRNLNLVKFKKQGKQVIYSLDDDHVLDLLKQGLDHTDHIEDI